MKVDISKLSAAQQRTIKTWLFQEEHEHVLRELALATGCDCYWLDRTIIVRKSFNSRLNAQEWLVGQSGQPLLTEKATYVTSGTPYVVYTHRKKGVINDVEYELHAVHKVQGLPGPNCRVVADSYYTVVCDPEVTQ